MARKKDKREKELDAVVDDLLRDHRPEDILRKDDLVQELTKRLRERALETEMTLVTRAAILMQVCTCLRFARVFMAE